MPTVQNTALGVVPGQPDDIPMLLAQDLDIAFVLQSAYLVFFMQCGFALLESGSVQRINVKNILLKNVMDFSLVVLVWWGVGYAFAYGACGDGPFIGHSNFFLSQSQYQTNTFFAHWLYTLFFCATSNAIVHGALSERTKFGAYLCYTALLAGWVYPVVVHWTWSLDGWLSAYRSPDCATGVREPLLSNSNGVMDFAGSGSVHMVGGTTALWGAIVLGPRLGRFNKDGFVVEFPANSPAFQALGTFALWFGWYGFNPGSTGCMYSCMFVASRVAVNTTIAAATGGLTVLFLNIFLGRPGDIGPMLNGIIVALVAITSPCAMIMPYAAFIIGMIAAMVYLCFAAGLRWLRIDDPLETSAVHLGGGIWGMLSVGFFATETSTYETFGYANDWGVFYGGQGYQLGVQLLGIVVIFAWVTAFMLPMWMLLHYTGRLRVDAADEKNGLDVAQSIGSGMPAWNFWLSSFQSSLRRRSARSTPSMGPPEQMGGTLTGPGVSVNDGNSTLSKIGNGTQRTAVEGDYYASV